jgi:hypothetical protein
MYLLHARLCLRHWDIGVNDIKSLYSLGSYVIELRKIMINKKSD